MDLLKAGARIAGAEMSQSGGNVTQFGGREGESADFREYDYDPELEGTRQTGKKDAELWSFLDARYPATPAQAAPDAGETDKMPNPGDGFAD